MFESNVIGTLQVTQALLPALVASGAGTILNVGSIAGRVAYEGGSGYVAAKHAVAAMTETLRLELVDQPVRVEEIAPGMVRTEEFSLTRFGGDQERADAVYAGVSEPLVAAGHRRRDRVDGRSDRPTSTSTCWSSSRASRPRRTRCTGSPEQVGFGQVGVVRQDAGRRGDRGAAREEARPDRAPRQTAASSSGWMLATWLVWPTFSARVICARRKLDAVGGAAVRVQPGPDALVGSHLRRSPR